MFYRICKFCRGLFLEIFIFKTTKNSFYKFYRFKRIQFRKKLHWKVCRAAEFMDFALSVCFISLLRSFSTIVIFLYKFLRKIAFLVISEKCSDISGCRFVFFSVALQKECEIGQRFQGSCYEYKTINEIQHLFPLALSVRTSATIPTKCQVSLFAVYNPSQ